MMSTGVLVPTIMGIAVVSVVGIRAVYAAISAKKNGDERKKWDVEEFTSHVSEFTAALKK